jgi:hypothetical protein
MKTLNNLNKKLLVAITLVGSAVTFAQEIKTENYESGFRLGFGVNAGIPINDPYDFNLGADARLQYDLNKTYSLTLTTGFNNFFVKGDSNDLGYIPLKGGFKAFVLKDQLYLMGEAGAAFAVTNGYDKTSFLLSPSVGYIAGNFDISLRYEHLSNFPSISNNQVKEGLGQVGLRLAYGFKI